MGDTFREKKFIEIREPHLISEECMRINNKDYTLIRTRLMDINTIIPLKIVKMWDEDFSIECVTKESVNIEGMRFQTTFKFESDCEYFLPDVAFLDKLYLFPEKDGRSVFDSISKWKDGIMERYSCILKREETISSEYRAEIACPKTDDQWTIKIQFNLLNEDCKIVVAVA